MIVMPLVFVVAGFVAMRMPMVVALLLRIVKDVLYTL
jgi:hypothetical protein